MRANGGFAFGQAGSRALAATVAGVALMVGLLGAGSEAEAGPAPKRPNIVVIQSDDQTVASMRFMDRTRALLGERGATFTNHYVNWPVCCPSRATLLTGQYSHNHGVLGNSPPEGGFQAFDNDHTTALWLQRRGYTTAHVGKFLNGYGNGDGADPVPPGWDEWYTTDGAGQAVYDYTLNENGALVEYGSDVDDFKQDVFTERAVQLIDEHVGAGRPLYLQLDYTAPHSGGPQPLPQPPNDCQRSARPAPRHANAFDSEPLPQDASFNEADVSDKPPAIADLPLLDQAAIDNLTRRYRCRIESLLSVDEGVAAVMNALAKSGAMGRTYVVYTSDNGFFTGEHRVANGKTRVYEPSSTVPLLIRGPGIPAGVSVRDLTINADLAASVVDLSGARPTLALDGRSLLPAAKRPWVERGRELLIDTAQYEAVHTQRYVWVEYDTGELELYDLREDPFQLRSAHNDPDYAGVRNRLANRLDDLRTCAGRSCRRSPALRLTLRRDKGPKGCTKPPLDASFAGGDRPQIRRAQFFVGARVVDTDSRKPFKHRYRRRELGKGSTLIRARAELADGRRIGWERRFSVCRAR
jgi:N-acetylglucosamine-6-sulfatase